MIPTSTVCEPFVKLHGKSAREVWIQDRVTGKVLAKIFRSGYGDVQWEIRTLDP